MSQTQSRRISIATALLAATLALAACGSGDSSTTAASSSTAASAASGSATAVDLADTGDLGEILVDGDGHTLYLFEKDTAAGASTCNGPCAQAWPPLTTKGDPEAGDGVDAGNLTTFKRNDGKTQVAYAGHPLYLYAGDGAAGDTNGNGLDQYGALWYALDSSGAAAKGDSGSAPDSSSGGGGYSY